MIKIPLGIQIAFIFVCLFFGIPGILLLILAFMIHHPIPILFGLIMCACGWIPLYIVIRKRIVKGQMLQTGTIVETHVVSVNLAYYNLFGWRPYIITTQWHDPITNLVYHFKSPALNYDPRTILTENMTLPVYLDPQNPKSRYYMAVEKVPEIYLYTPKTDT